MASIPQEIKDIYEEFTQMYEKSKRGTTTAKNQIAPD